MIDEFLTYLRVEQRMSPNTVEAYGRDLRQFAAWLCTADKAFDAQSVTVADIRAWIGSLADEGNSAPTLRRKAQSLRAFFRWGMRRRGFTANPAADITLAKKRRKLPNFIREDEMEEILAAEETGFTSRRTHLILSMLYSLGLREAELIGLTDADIDLHRGELRVTGKRDKQRVVPVPEELCREIADWQKTRDSRYRGLPMPRPLIAGPHGRVSKQTVYRAVRDGLTGATSGRKSPHTLRHTFATAMINNGADLDAVREMLGHSSIATTQIYTHLSFRELLDNYRLGHPRSHTPDSAAKEEDERRK